MGVSLAVFLKEVSELLYGGELGLAHVCKCGGWFFVVEDLNELLCCSDRYVRRGEIRDGCSLWKKFDGVAGSFCFCFADKDAVAAIVFHGWSNVPSGGAMGIPGSSYLGFFMDHHFGAGGRHGCFIEIENTFQYGVGGQFGVSA